MAPELRINILKRPSCNVDMSALPHTQETHPSGNHVSASRLGFLALSTLRGIGYQTLWNIAESGFQFGNVFREDADAALSSLRQLGGRIEEEVNNDETSFLDKIKRRAEELLAELETANVHILFRSDPVFPRSLLNVSSPPHWLFVQGDPKVLSIPSISVVGTREPSDYGLWLAEFVGLCLRFWNCPTVSGLAVGIDQRIHTASLDNKVPTIAVLGTGILSNYPSNTAPLRERMIDAGGAIVTEYLPSEKYSSQHFVRRNRLQAALGRVLVPVEWAPKSGTAHTVRFASELGRPIALFGAPSISEQGMKKMKDQSGPTSALFNIPGDEREFRDFVSLALSRENVPSTYPIEPKQRQLL